MKTSRAMTLIELLVSLSLLAVISMIGASWMTMMLRTQSTAIADGAWDRSASAVLDLLERDIFVVDRLDVGGRGSTPRVGITDGILRIRTRDQGIAEVIEYTFNQEKNQITRSTIGAESRDAGPPLLGEVAEFSIDIELQSELTPLPILHTRLEHADGRSYERTFTLAVEDIR